MLRCGKNGKINCFLSHSPCCDSTLLQSFSNSARFEVPAEVGRLLRQAFQARKKLVNIILYFLYFTCEIQYAQSAFCIGLFTCEKYNQSSSRIKRANQSQRENSNGFQRGWENKWTSPTAVYSLKTRLHLLFL